MKFLVPGIASAIAGAVLAFAVVLPVTGLVEENTRPEINREGAENSSVLNQVQYGSR